MTPEYILRKSLCRQPHCASGDWRSTAERLIEDMQFTTEYAEPGYDNPKRAILFSDWNYFPREIGDVLEKAGFAIEWEDEWCLCDGCQQALRTSPDCYSWQPSYIETVDGNRYCVECLSTEDIDETFQNNPQRAVNLADIDMTKHGYAEIQCGFESGWHPGQNDNPQTIYDDLIKRGYRNLVFQVNEQSQFYIGFCVWQKVCDVCGGKRYLVSTRDDGFEAIECCDECRHDDDSDESAVPLAAKDGIIASTAYPCYVLCHWSL